MNNNNPQVLLIYFNFKGLGQIVRHLLCYLNIPFIDILIDEYQKQRLVLPPKILQILRSHPINKTELPAIIHNNEIIYQLNHIMLYICLTFQREDLLGVDLYQKARVIEILELYNLKQLINIRFHSCVIEEIHQRSLDGLELISFLDEKFQNFLVQSGYAKQLTAYLTSQNNPKFILGNITIADFYFIESCKYILSLYGNIDEKLANEKWTQMAFSYRLIKKAKGEIVENIDVLRTMKAYQQFYYNQEFFMRFRGYLQTYGFLPKTTSQKHVAIMKKVQAVYFPDMYYKERQ